MDQGPPQKAQDPGAPAWVMTFADLMSLLMCFFVLLLSFSEIDRELYKQLAGSMKMAFGVQKEIEVKGVPKGISVIKQEFSPGTPRPTVKNVVKQDSTDSLKQNLKLEQKETEQTLGSNVQNRNAGKESEARKARIREHMKKIKSALRKQIKKGTIKVDQGDRGITIRIMEKGSFSSGSADLEWKFIPILKKIADFLVTTDYKIVVAGHSDDIPISTFGFRSNWELSSSRSVSVIHELISGGLGRERIHVEGYADTQPLKKNVNSTNRAANRRVEIILIEPEKEEEQQTAANNNPGSSTNNTQNPQLNPTGVSTSRAKQTEILNRLGGGAVQVEPTKRGSASDPRSALSNTR